MWQWRSDHPSSRSSSFICEEGITRRLTALPSASPVPRSQRRQPLRLFPSGENTHSCTRSPSLVPHRSCHFLLLSIRHSASGWKRAAESHECCCSSVIQRHLSAAGARLRPAGHAAFLCEQNQWEMGLNCLNDDSGLCISSMQKRMLFAGLTAAKKTIIQNWFTPHMCRKTYWIRSLLQIVTYECTTARINGARPSTIDAWQCFLLNIRDCIKEWLVLCFLSLPYDWTFEMLSVCLLFCFVIFWMLCYDVVYEK